MSKQSTRCSTKSAHFSLKESFSAPKLLKKLVLILYHNKSYLLRSPQNMIRYRGYHKVTNWSIMHELLILASAKYVLSHERLVSWWNTFLEIAFNMFPQIGKMTPPKTFTCWSLEPTEHNLPFLQLGPCMHWQQK